MISNIERVFRATPWAELRQAWIDRARAQAGRMLDRDVFEPLHGYGRDSSIAADGREIIHIAGKSYALRPEVHTERLALALESAKTQNPEHETKSVVGTESMSAMTCPKCGDALQHTAVCPKCAAGKLGYRHRYTCACGGVDLISKGAL